MNKYFLKRKTFCSLKRSGLVVSIIALVVLLSGSARAQVYPPPAGMPGTTAIDKDSSVFKSWAVACTVKRGLQDISNPSAEFASAGDSTMATGKAMSNGAVSLGDGGFAVCIFAHGIMDGPGFDFAVFENGFDDTFLELAFVEVSSDGVNYFRLPAHSLTDTTMQTSSFGPTDAAKINNLAGKYRGGYGTPFDIADIGSSPLLNPAAITHVLIRDVVGSINPAYGTRDSFHALINDPWPTAFPSGGFDLDAVGVIHESIVLSVTRLNQPVKLFPNPATDWLNVECDGPVTVELYNHSGTPEIYTSDKRISVMELPKGLYFVKLRTSSEVFFKKIIIE